MKSDLDARPVYLQLENTIKGHFLICYLTVLLQRIFQFKVLENKYSSSELNEFYKAFQFVEGEDSYTNISIGTNFITELSDMTGLPLDNYFLSPTKLKKVLNYRF
ncbi:Transposase [Chlamydia trachomatis]|nr:Transposase [Chlamydia trachomatis]